MPSPAERFAIAEPFIAKYRKGCQRIVTAQNVTHVVDLLAQERITASGSKLSYRQAVAAVLVADPDLAAAYGQED